MAEDPGPWLNCVSDLLPSAASPFARTNDDRNISIARH